MAGKGRSYTFHGAFKKKADAKRKKGATPGSLVKRVHPRAGDGRWLVLKPKRGRARKR